MAIIRIARLWPGAERAAAAAAIAPIIPVEADPEDSLDAFGSESIVTPVVSTPGENPVSAPGPAAAAARDWRRLRSALLWTLILGLGAAGPAAGVWAYRQRLVPATGALTIETSPAGIAVAIDGRPAGVTPLTIALPPATYAIQVGAGEERRDLSINLLAGASILQHFELRAPVSMAAAATTGALLIQTEPSGQTVAVDGIQRGASPLTVAGLAAGDHTVVVRGVRGTLRRSVSVKAGETMSLLVAPVAPSTPSPGWLSVQAATRLELREAGKLLGATDTEQIMLPAGDHDIELVNEAVGYRSRRRVEVLPGQVTRVPVELPFGALSVNAQPWAEVWINGERVGETPIANLARRIGSYDVVFRHPEFGERRETVNVTLRQPARLGVDMRSK